MLKEIYAERTIELDCNQQAALPFIWDIKNIEYCEVKADKVQVTKETETTGKYRVDGHFAGVRGLFPGIPWHRRFEYRLHPTGFHSKEAELPVSVLDIQGGFVVEPINDARCKIIHYEQYTLPPIFVPLKPLIVWYLLWSQGRELRDLQSMIMRSLAGKAA